MANANTRQRPRSGTAPRRRQQPNRTAPARRRKSRWKNEGGMDIMFMVLVLILLAIGLVMLFSASYSYSYYYKGSGTYFFKRQLIFAILGLILMFAVSRFDYHKFKPTSPWILGITYILLVVVLFAPQPEGFEEFHRWIRLGSFSFQPSEIAKFALILFLSWHVDRNYMRINTKAPSTSRLGQMFLGPDGKSRIKARTEDLILYLVIILSMAFLVYLENHVSGAILIVLLGIVMLYLAGFSQRGIAVFCLIIVVAALIVVADPKILPEHAAYRITAWRNKDYQPTGQRWQTNQALYAIGSGGFFGVGLGNSKMKQLYVSEPQNDFIFSIVCEELGFLGALIIIVLFALLVWRGFVIGIHARDKFGAFMSMGMSFQIGLQVVLNILVVTDMMPNTGISLPFFSYGGTSLLMLLFEMGIILAISREAKLRKN